jgi:hypothetical protein
MRKIKGFYGAAKAAPLQNTPNNKDTPNKDMPNKPMPNKPMPNKPIAEPALLAAVKWVRDDNHKERSTA